LRANRRLVERVFLAMGLTFVSYISPPSRCIPVGRVGHALVIPSFAHPPIAPDATAYNHRRHHPDRHQHHPYMQLFLQSSIVDKGLGEGARLRPAD